MDGNFKADRVLYSCISLKQSCSDNSGRMRQYLHIITVVWETGSFFGVVCEGRLGMKRGNHGIMKDLQNNDTYVPILHHSLSWDNISRIRDDRP